MQDGRIISDVLNGKSRPTGKEASP